MTRVCKILVFFIVLAVTASCDQTNLWSEALEETAPANPREKQIGAPKPDVSSRESESQRRERPVRRAARPVEDQRKAPAGRRTLGRGSTLELRPEGDVSCISGKVRCSVDGVFVGEVVPGGFLSFDLAPGKHLFEGYDNRGGRWWSEFEIRPGQVFKLSISCEARRATSDF